nr:condensation domain-containing protein [Mangrovicoccus sp. HB161399]
MTDLTAACDPGPVADEAEERLWLQSQQAPETMPPDCHALALPELPPLPELLARIGGMAQALPGAGQCYRFGSDGLLRRHPAPLPLAEIRSTGRPEEAGALLAAIREEPWDLSLRAPVRAVAIAAPGRSLLALLRHPVLGSRASLADLFACLAGEPPRGAATAPGLTPLAAALADGCGLAPGAALAAAAAGLSRHLERPGSAPGLVLQPLGGAPAASGAPAAGPEEIILDEFRAALDAPGMAATDDFFDFGGHSLVATRVIGRLQSRHGLELRFADFFRAATARGLSRHVSQVRAEPPAAPGSAAPEPAASYPLSLAQQSLWRAYARFGKGAIFNIPFALRFLGPVDQDAFGRAFRDLLVRHPVLRSLFREEAGRPVQSPVPVAEIDRHDWFRPACRNAGVSRPAEAEHVFDLSRELPLRLRFLDDGGEGPLLSMLFHHVAIDEWSLNQLMQELARAYAARCRGEAPAWDSAPPPFHAFAARQEEAAETARHLPYWTRMLEGAPLAQPLFADAPAAEDSGAAGGWVEIRLAPEEADGLVRLARGQEASLFNAAYAAIAAMQHRVAGVTDAVIGTSASGRTDPEFFDTAGYFTTVVAHRIRMAPEMTVGALVAQVRDVIAESQPHGGIPIDLVGAALHGGESPPVDRLFETFIQIHAQNRLNGALPGPDGRPVGFRQVDPEKTEALLGLQFEIMEEMAGGRREMRVLMSYRAGRYSPARVAQLQAATAAMFRQFAAEGAADLRLDALAP